MNINRNQNFKGIELIKKRSVKYCCESQCFNLVPICFLRITHDCSESNNKWYHLSNGEHICNNCVNRILSCFCYELSCPEIIEWKKEWILKSYDNAAVNDYISNKMLPYWCVCVHCGRWRQVSRNIIITPSVIETFNCSFLIKHTEEPCKVAEDKRVELIQKHSHQFLESLDYGALLETTLNLQPFTSSSLDVTGLYPSANMVDFDLPNISSEFLKRFHPFQKLSVLSVADGAFNPMIMERWEVSMFPMFKNKQKYLYLGIRNLMLLLWAADPKRPVDMKLMNKCCLIRGLIRVAMLQTFIPEMIRIYTGMGHINYGFLPNLLSDELLIFSPKDKVKIVIVGASLSGLSAAMHLQNVGADVQLLESSQCEQFGRTKCSKKLKQIFSLQEIEGSINNPLAVLAYQVNLGLKLYGEEMVVYDWLQGKMVNNEDDEYYQNIVYNFVAYLQSHRYTLTDLIKTNGSTVLMDIYRKYKKNNQTSQKLSQNSNSALNPIECVYLAEIEYRLFKGYSLNQIRNDIELPLDLIEKNIGSKHFSGANLTPDHSDGNHDNANTTGENWDVILERFSNLNIQYSTKVITIQEKSTCNSSNTNMNTSDSGNTEKYLSVITNSGEQFEANYVVLAVSQKKQAEIMGNIDVPNETIGGILVTLTMDKSKVFWGMDHPIISITPVNEEMRGFCHLFKMYSKKNGKVVVQSSIFGDALEKYVNKLDKEIVDAVLQKLSSLYKGDIWVNEKKELLSVIESQIIRLPSSNITSDKTETDDIDASKLFQSGCIFRTNKVNNLSEPISLTGSFCAGMEVASELIESNLSV